ncbi:MAG TPA: RsmE family RNA methyltransferase [Acidimicrobiia bacterium]|nr:RsmE family RNA methyltransferase [Acidimicrobiia bacterium]
MPHIPHLFLEPPWGERGIELSAVQVNHLFKALRLGRGSEVSYTDGRGVIGSGELTATQVMRGEESKVTPPIDLEVAVAPPHERDRIRFLVEKAAELEVRRIRWLRTRFGNARPNQFARAGDWAVAALEQSRGAWLTAVDRDWVGTADLEPERATVVADPGGDRFIPPPPLRVIVGPEGGWAENELPTEWPRLSLGRTVLRTETAVVAAVLAVSSYSTNFAGD